MNLKTLAYSLLNCSQTVTLFFQNIVQSYMAGVEIPTGLVPMNAKSLSIRLEVKLF